MGQSAGLNQKQMNADFPDSGHSRGPGSLVGKLMNETKKGAVPDSGGSMPGAPRQPRLKRGLVVTMWLVGAFLIATFILIVPMIVSGTERQAVVRIPRNATERNVEDSLRAAFGEDYAKKVMKLVKVRNIDFSKRHGAYLIEEGSSPLETSRKLGSGAQMPVKLTINGFRSLDALSGRVAAKLDLGRDSLVRQATDPMFLKRYGLNKEQALALFVNDTYEVYWSTPAKGVLEKIGAHYLNFWTPERIAKAADLGLTPAETMVLSTIVDEETNDMREKGRIGRLYVNRLQKGMKLQSDPTVRFALNDFTIKRVKGNHLKVNSPYNTYMVQGLPPGPIRTPSLRTVELILDSEPSEDLYMCAKEDFSGSHNFASTYAEHQANARRYQDALTQRGIE